MVAKGFERLCAPALTNLKAARENNNPAGRDFSAGSAASGGNGIELEAVGLRFEPYRWRPCGVTWDSSRTVVVIKLRRTSALIHHLTLGVAGPVAGPGSVEHTRGLLLFHVRTVYT